MVIGRVMKTGVAGMLPCGGGTCTIHAPVTERKWLALARLNEIADSGGAPLRHHLGRPPVGHFFLEARNRAEKDAGESAQASPAESWQGYDPLKSPPNG
jgi:hypothetical protein